MVDAEDDSVYDDQDQLDYVASISADEAYKDSEQASSAKPDPKDVLPQSGSPINAVGDLTKGKAGELGESVGGELGKEAAEVGVDAAKVAAGAATGDATAVAQGAAGIANSRVGRFAAAVNWGAGIAASLINPATLVVIGITLAILALSFSTMSVVQTIGRNDNSCEGKSDCSAAEMEKCGDFAISSSFSGGAFPAAGSDDAIKATYSLLKSAGLSDADAYLMTAVAGAESGWNPKAKTPGGSYIGLFQFGAGTAAGAGFSHADMLRADKAAAAAAKIYKSRGPQPWAGWPGSNLSILYPKSNPRAKIISTWTTKSNRVKSVLGGQGLKLDGSHKAGEGGIVPGWGVKGVNGEPPYSDSSATLGNVGGDCMGANGTCGPECAKALQGAKAKIGNCKGWNGRCAAFVARASWGSGWCGPVPASPGGCWARNGLTLAKRHNQANKVTDWKSVPAGAILIRDAMNTPYGHTAIMSDKPGYAITTAAEGVAAGNCIVEVNIEGKFDENRYFWVDPKFFKSRM